MFRCRHKPSRTVSTFCTVATLGIKPRSEKHLSTQTPLYAVVVEVVKEKLHNCIAGRSSIVACDPALHRSEEQIAKTRW